MDVLVWFIFLQGHPKRVNVIIVEAPAQGHRQNINKVENQKRL